MHQIASWSAADWSMAVAVTLAVIAVGVYMTYFRKKPQPVTPEEVLEVFHSKNLRGMTHEQITEEIFRKRKDLDDSRYTPRGLWKSLAFLLRENKLKYRDDDRRYHIVTDA